MSNVPDWEAGGERNELLMAVPSTPDAPFMSK
jgi:hypothetical protein